MKEVRLARQDSNPLCRKCARLCRQPVACILVDCPRFLPLPFKIAAPPADQLDLFTTEEKPDNRPLRAFTPEKAVAADQS